MISWKNTKIKAHFHGNRWYQAFKSPVNLSFWCHYFLDLVVLGPNCFSPLRYIPNEKRFQHGEKKKWNMSTFIWKRNTWVRQLTLNLSEGGLFSVFDSQIYKRVAHFSHPFQRNRKKKSLSFAWTFLSQSNKTSSPSYPSFTSHDFFLPELRMRVVFFETASDKWCVAKRTRIPQRKLLELNFKDIANFNC